MTDIEEQQLLDDALNRIKRIIPKIATLSEEVACLRKQNAVMREALEELLTAASDHIELDMDGIPGCTCCGVELDQRGDGHRNTCLAMAIFQRASTVKPDAGSTLLTREQLQPFLRLVTDLEIFCMWAKEPGVPHPNALDAASNVDESLAAAKSHARTLGFQ